MLREVKRALAEAINYRLHLRHGTHRITVPVMAGVGRTNRQAHEAHLFSVLSMLHAQRNGALLVDIGVNIGQTLIKYALIAGPKCRYIGFEPNPKAASYADEIIRKNGMSNAQIVPLALGAKTMLATLFLSSAHSTDSMASMKAGFRDEKFYAAKQVIPVFQGDDVLRTLGVSEKNFIVKIDVEGSELDVITGMVETLREQRPLVVMEILPPREKFSEEVRQFRDSQSGQIKSFMRDLNYEIRRIAENGSLVEDSAEGTDDYLFIPSELMSNFQYFTGWRDRML